jgi:hypothetical protein
MAQRRIRPILHLTWYWQKRAASYMSNKTSNYACLRRYLHVGCNPTKGFKLLKLIYKTIALLIKRNIILAFLIFFSVTCLSQVDDTTIIEKSKVIRLKYSPRTPVTQTTITFLKFKEAYGIQLSFMTPSQFIPHIFIESIDSLVLNLAGDKKIVLNKPYPDTKYNDLPNTHIFQISYIIDRGQINEMSKQKIVEILTSHGSRPLTLRLKKVSQNDILNTVSAFK